MHKAKTVLFVPGYPEDITSRDYQSVLYAIESKGYKVKFVPIKWQRSTIKDWVAELQEVYAQHEPSETILAGFSFGAMTALVTAAEKNPSQLWLFSLSAFFSDDIPTLRKSWLNEIGHRRADAFRQTDFNELTSRIHCPTLIMLGEAEATKFPEMSARAKMAIQSISGSRFVSIEGTGHDVGDPRYIKSILSAT